MAERKELIAIYNSSATSTVPAAERKHLIDRDVAGRQARPMLDAKANFA